MSNGDATVDVDYTGPANGTLAWADGDADPKWIEYSIVDDGQDEADEFIELMLSNASAGTIGQMAQLRINIINSTVANDPPPPARSGGGAASLWLLLALLILNLPGATRRAITRTDAF